MEKIKTIIKKLPNLPGVYQFYDSNNEIIYIGKAKNLRNRVSSYFNQRKYDTYKTKKLASQVADIKHIIVPTEADALLLENNLIKKYQPKYNILLKDDKTFPWIGIKNERFPRVFSTRSYIKDGTKYFGPYTSAYLVKTLLELIRKIYKLRTCNYNLTKENVKRRKFKKCLEFHIGNCKAPCEGDQSEIDYHESINQILNILKGNIQDVIQHLNSEMLKFAESFQYEEAESIKQKIELLKSYQAKSTVVSTTINNLDVFSYIEKDKNAFINFLKIVNGAIIQSHSVEVVRKLQETKEEILLYAILNIREKVASESKEILIPFKLENFSNLKFIVPKVGDKRKLLELSERNAKQFYLQKQSIKEGIKEGKSKNSRLELAKKDLRLRAIPKRIECFDNSNIQGSDPVAACVVFINGKPAKKEYRHFNIKSVEGPNDFASMEEVIERRYSRILKESKELPELIVIDGGKGQLSSAVKSLKRLKIYDRVAIIGIAKKLEEIYFPNDPMPIYIDKNSPTLRLIQNLRNEAHRFGISFHRDKRSKGMLQNQIEAIPGIGSKTAVKLYTRYKSLEGIKKAPEQELIELIGKRLAKKLIENI